ASGAACYEHRPRDPQEVSPVSTKQPTPRAAAGKRGSSLTDNIEGVLRASDGPMNVADILAALKSKRKAPATKDPRDSIVQATFAHGGTGKGGAKDSRLVKVGPATYDLRELNPRGAKTRPGVK